MSQIVLAFWLVLTYDQLEDRRMDDVINILLCLLDETNRFHVVVRLCSYRSRVTSKCDKNKKVPHEVIAKFVSDVLFDVFCDLLLNRRTMTWNLFVKLRFHHLHSVIFCLTPRKKTNIRAQFRSNTDRHAHTAKTEIFRSIQGPWLEVHLQYPVRIRHFIQIRLQYTRYTTRIAYTLKYLRHHRFGASEISEIHAKLYSPFSKWRILIRRGILMLCVSCRKFFFFFNVWEAQRPYWVVRWTPDRDLEGMKYAFVLFLLEPASFRGNVTVSFTEWRNPFVGPSGTHLVSLGALFPPCMREDHAVNVNQVQTWYPRPGSGESLGCCEVPHFNIAGTTTEVTLYSPTESFEAEFWEYVTVAPICLK